MKPRLIFVYNAKGGILNKAIDAVHKIISPTTYRCELCALTHDTVGIKRQWDDFLARLEYEKAFYYKEEWEQATAYIEAPLPVALLQRNAAEEPEVILSKKEMQQMKDLQELIEILEHKLT